jgi:hypothetical protein
MSGDEYTGSGNRPGHTSDDFYSYGADRTDAPRIVADDLAYMLPAVPVTSHGGKRASRKNRRVQSVKSRRANRRAS